MLIVFITSDLNRIEQTMEKIGKYYEAPEITKLDIDYLNKMSVVKFDWQKERKDEFTRIRGRIKNTGTKTVTYLKVTAWYLDGAGHVLDTHSINIVENLFPEMAKEFEIIHRYSPDYKQVRVFVDEIRLK